MSRKPVVHHTFVIEKFYSFSPEKVFAGFSDPKVKRRWMGGDDDDFQVESFEPNFKVDCCERWRFRPKGGALIKNDTCYRNIVQNERIVFTYTMDIGDDRISLSQTTIEFNPSEQGTKLILTEQAVFFEKADSPKEREKGTRDLLDKLEKELAR